jgi:acyl-coenzyme A synthetase/AMP-(fatty) acid ligase
MSAARLSDMAAKALGTDPEQPALLYAGHWHLWGAFARLAWEIGTLLDDGGVDGHAPVALVGRNRPETVAALLGLIAQGRTIRMIYAYQSATAIIGEIERLAPAAVVAMRDDLTEPVLAAMRASGRAVLCLDAMTASVPPGLGRSRADVPGLTGDPAIEVLTSGTTGPPKSFPLPFAMIAQHMVGIAIRPEEAAIAVPALPPAFMAMPMGNISGIYTIIPPLLTGQRGILLDRFDLRAWRDWLVEYRPPYASVIPAAIQMIIEADVPPDEFASLQCLSAGAAAVDPRVQHIFEQRYGIPLLSSYGATEFGGPVTAMNLADRTSFGDGVANSVGRALPGSQVRVVDPDSGLELPPGQQGLMEVMTKRMGLHWIRTSDLGVIDANGFIFHKGRADGAIVRGGFKLLPERIEQALMLHNAVACVAVTGVPDARLGEVPGAVIQTAPGNAMPTPAELEMVVRQTLPATHVPVHWRFLSEMPRTQSQKVDRRAIRQLFSPE